MLEDNSDVVRRGADALIRSVACHGDIHLVTHLVDRIDLHHERALAREYIPDLYRLALDAMPDDAARAAALATWLAPPASPDGYEDPPSIWARATLREFLPRSALSTPRDRSRPG